MFSAGICIHPAETPENSRACRQRTQRRRRAHSPARNSARISRSGNFRSLQRLARLVQTKHENGVRKTRRNCKKTRSSTAREVRRNRGWEVRPARRRSSGDGFQSAAKGISGGGDRNGKRGKCNAQNLGRCALGRGRYRAVADILRRRNVRDRHLQRRAFQAFQPKIRGADTLCGHRLFRRSRRKRLRANRPIHNTAERARLSENSAPLDFRQAHIRTPFRSRGLAPLLGRGNACRKVGSARRRGACFGVRARNFCRGVCRRRTLGDVDWLPRRRIGGRLRSNRSV